MACGTSSLFAEAAATARRVGVNTNKHNTKTVMYREGFRAAELKALGADLPALVTAGYSVKELKELGFLLSQLLEAGLGFKKMGGGRIMRCTAQYFSRRPACC